MRHDDDDVDDGQESSPSNPYDHNHEHIKYVDDGEEK